jgi:hypothetical protein
MGTPYVIRYTTYIVLILAARAIATPVPQRPTQQAGMTASGIMIYVLRKSNLIFWLACTKCLPLPEAEAEIKYFPP